MDTRAGKAVAADRALLVAVGFLGLLVVTLSFMPWMTYGYFPMVSVNGNEMKGVADLGDGWVTAIAGATAALVAVASLLSNLRGQLVASGIAVCGSLIACVAGYDLVKPWEGPRPGFLGLIIVEHGFEVTREPALWATAVAGLAIAIGGFALLAAANRHKPFADDPSERWETEAWA